MASGGLYSLINIPIHSPNNYLCALDTTLNNVVFQLTHTYLLLSCCLVKAGAGDLLFLIDLKIPLFDLIWLFSKSQCSYQNLLFDNVKILFIYFNILMMLNKISIQ